MSEKPAGPEESSVPLFDVVVKIPSGTSLQDIERLARDVAEIPSDRVDKLMAALRNTPQAKIGAAVTKERADKAREQFGKAGLTVEVTGTVSACPMTDGFSLAGPEALVDLGAQVLTPVVRELYAVLVQFGLVVVE